MKFKLLTLQWSLALSLLLVGRLCIAQTTTERTSEPSKDEFIQVSEEPTPITPISSLVVYPEAARRAGLEGRVIVEALIDKDGSVKKAEILKSTANVRSEQRTDEAAAKILENEAVRAVMSAKFTPAVQDGERIKVWYTIPINFKLTDAPHEAKKNVDEPAAEEFVYVTEEPIPLAPIDSAIQYPLEAKRLGIEGDVKARILIESDGSVSKVVVDQSPAPALSAEATRVLKSTTFTPAKDGGKPVHVWTQQTVHFRLH